MVLSLASNGAPMNGKQGKQWATTAAPIIEINMLMEASCNRKIEEWKKTSCSAAAAGDLLLLQKKNRKAR
jgi:hypothetical protein